MFFKSRTFFYFFAFAALSAALVFSPKAFADTYQCDTPEQKAACTQLLNQTEAEINDLNSQLGTVKQEGSSLARDKQILDIQIKQAQLQIKAHQLTIANLGKDIAAKTQTIKTLQSHIDTGTASLGQILRQTNQIDDYSIPELFLGNTNLSDSFADLDAFDTLKSSLGEVFTQLKDSQQANEIAKVDLGKQQDKEIDTKAGIESEKAKVQVAEAEKQRLLNLNQTQQQSYQTVIAQKASQAAQIKAALFKLAGASAIPFGDALKYAQTVQAATGVEPAFLLAIIKQESNLGSNVGQCNLTDTTSGAGVNINSGRIWPNLMKPSRDIPPFLDITSALGFDPLKTSVSCPIAGAGGYGGAMGPAQFIPSTWKLFVSRITAATGHSTPNPWAPEDAFMASAMYLSDLGASGGSVAAESRAACKYYGSGGSSCVYSRSVINLKNSIQADIDVLGGN
jgi:membrane-bound lytic murein transglycosylase B